jgi:hypothetical protein
MLVTLLLTASLSIASAQQAKDSQQAAAVHPSIRPIDGWADRLMSRRISGKDQLLGLQLWQGGQLKLNKALGLDLTTADVIKSYLDSARRDGRISEGIERLESARQGYLGSRQDVDAKAGIALAPYAQWLKSLAKTAPELRSPGQAPRSPSDFVKYSIVWLSNLQVRGVQEAISKDPTCLEPMLFASYHSGNLVYSRQKLAELRKQYPKKASIAIYSAISWEQASRGTKPELNVASSFKDAIKEAQRAQRLDPSLPLPWLMEALNQLTPRERRRPLLEQYFKCNDVSSNRLKMAREAMKSL